MNTESGGGEERTKEKMRRGEEKMKLQMTKNSCYDCVLHLQIIYCG